MLPEDDDDDEEDEEDSSNDGSDTSSGSSSSSSSSEDAPGALEEDFTPAVVDDGAEAVFDAPDDDDDALLCPSPLQPPPRAESSQGADAEPEEREGSYAETQEHCNMGLNIEGVARTTHQLEKSFYMKLVRKGFSTDELNMIAAVGFSSLRALSSVSDEDMPQLLEQAAPLSSLKGALLERLRQKLRAARKANRRRILTEHKEDIKRVTKRARTR